jgi:hypothetical protein
MVRQVMPEFKTMKNVIIPCDSWYVKKNLVSIVDDLYSHVLDRRRFCLRSAPAGKAGKSPWNRRHMQP